MENVRQSNFAYSQTKIGEYLSCYFAFVGIGSSIIASEIMRLHNKDDKNEQWIKMLQYISLGATIATSKNLSVS